MSLAPLPPYALAAPSFPFRHLVGLAGRAPIGGAREVALACFVVARLAADQMQVVDDDNTARVSRCAGAKTWLGTLALPSPVRASASRCAEATIAGTKHDVARELTAVIGAAASFLDAQSRHELETLATTLRS